MRHRHPGASAAIEAEARQLKTAFLGHYWRLGVVTAACEAAGVARRRPYKWQEHDEEFAMNCHEAAVEAVEVLEEEARRRAVDGVEKPVYFAGKMVGKVREYRDTLLIALLKARAPEKYRERVDLRTSTSPDLGDTLNVPMFRVNDTLGFVKQPESLTLQKDL